MDQVPAYHRLWASHSGWIPSQDREDPRSIALRFPLLGPAFEARSLADGRRWPILLFFGRLGLRAALRAGASHDHEAMRVDPAHDLGQGLPRAPSTAELVQDDLDAVHLLLGEA